jgi:septal ring factor EnvC (AmiA/AmiB activator)
MPSWIEKHSDTLITIATIIVAFAALVAIVDQRLDAQDELISQRFDAQDRHINQRFDAVDQRFDAMDKRIDRLTEEVSELRRLTVSISERVSRNEGQIDVIREQIQAADTPSP